MSSKIKNIWKQTNSKTILQPTCHPKKTPWSLGVAKPFVTKILWLKFFDCSLVTKKLWLKCCDGSFLTTFFWLKFGDWNLCDWHFVIKILWLKTQQLKLWWNSKTQLVTKIRNLNCDKIHKLKFLFFLKNPLRKEREKNAFDFCHDLRLWVLSNFEFWVLSQFKFLSFVTF